MTTVNCQSIILTGPPGCGKSFWIQQYAKEIKKDFFEGMVSSGKLHVSLHLK